MMIEIIQKKIDEFKHQLNRFKNPYEVDVNNPWYESSVRNYHELQSKIDDFENLLMEIKKHKKNNDT